LVTRFSRQSAVKVNLRLSPRISRISSQAQEVIYRVSQEALQNVMKHSQASSVKLLVTFDDKKIRLSIRDNGVGFDPNTARRKPLSFGLTGMQERAALVGGTLRIESAKGKGVAVILELPSASLKGAR